jgi:hypothetical protein
VCLSSAAPLVPGGSRAQEQRVRCVRASGGEGCADRRRRPEGLGATCRRTGAAHPCKSLPPALLPTLQIIDLPEHNPILTEGYRSILHIHSAVEEAEVTRLLAAIDPKTREEKKVKFVKVGAVCRYVAQA